MQACERRGYEAVGDSVCKLTFIQHLILGVGMRCEGLCVCKLMFTQHFISGVGMRLWGAVCVNGCFL